MSQSNGVWGRRPRPAIVTLLVAALLLLVFSHPLIHGDGVSYLVYLDSIGRDGDLDLTNQVELFAPAIAYPYATSQYTGTPVTPFPFGSAYLLAPFYWLGRAGEPAIPALHGNAEHFVAIQGLPLAYSLAATLGSLAYALAAVGLACATARRLAPGWAAGLSAVACLAGTPLLYYAAIEPLDAHVYGAFALSLAIWLAGHDFLNRQGAQDANPPKVSWRPGGWPNALAIGLALGLAVLVRWQLLLYALPIGAALVWQAGQVRADTGRHIGRPLGRAVGVSLAFAAGLGIYCGVCMLYFWRFFGAPLIVPNDAITGKSFVGAPLRYLPQVLFARHNGWLSWSPIAALGLAGLLGIAAASRGWRRALALAGLAGIALELALNASTDDWYGGWSFGQRRMAEAYPLLVLGAAWLLGRWRGWAAGAVLLCALFGLFLLVAHLYYTHTSGHPEGAGIAEVARWLLTGPHGPTPIEVFRDRYGPWAWARPEL
jgi:hypothetical protein